MLNYFISGVFFVGAVVLFIAARKGWIDNPTLDALDKIGGFLAFLVALLLIVWQPFSSANEQIGEAQNSLSGATATQVVAIAPNPSHTPTTGLILTQTAEANGLELGCREFHYVFLVDQSNSMFGSMDSDGSDPLMNRFYAIESAIDQMVDIALDEAPGSIFHVSVVHFGTDSNIVLSRATIGPFQPSEFEEAYEERASIKSQILPAQEGKGMGEALFKAPFMHAEYLLGSVESYQDNCPGRYIIMLTDGRPYVNDVADYDWQDHMLDLSEFVQDHLRPIGATIFVLGIDENDSYWDETSRLWESVTRSDLETRYKLVIRLPKSRSAVPETISTILRETVFSE